MTLKIVGISDTHNRLDQLKIPDGDVLVHAGDGLSAGDLMELERLALHSKPLKERFKLMIYSPGNHCKIFQHMGPLARDILEKAGWVVLIDEPYVFEGVKFYASPWTLVLRRQDSKWAFKKMSREIKEYWAGIPADTDVLITHQPPYGIADAVMDMQCVDHETGEVGKLRRLGCPDLLKRVLEIKPKVHFFGHVHWSGGQVVRKDGVTFINAACLNEAYLPAIHGSVVDL